MFFDQLVDLKNCFRGNGDRVFCLRHFGGLEVGNLRRPNLLNNVQLVFVLNPAPFQLRIKYEHQSVRDIANSMGDEMHPAWERRCTKQLNRAHVRWRNGRRPVA